jgi:ATP-binding cassette subfamily F protein uup
MILTIENLTKSYGEKVLFENVSLGIDEGDKIGIVGVNGTGKSTFIRTVAGTVPADSGNIVTMKNIQQEYLEQDKIFLSENTVLMEVFKGNKPIMKALCDYEIALSDSKKYPENQDLQEKIMQLTQRIDELDGWQMESDAKTILTKLGISDFTAKAGELSGGQQKRLALATALIHPCDLLFLDEPTNHLDSETIAWLEEYLRKIKGGALLLVTHDRYFLDCVATKILELDKGKAYVYTGNYTEFLELKAAREDRDEASERKRQNLLRNELAWMRRGAQARSTKQKARIERYEDTKNKKVDLSHDNVEIGLAGSRLGRTVIELDHVNYMADARKLIDDFSYIILRNDRVGILGPNGSGKTTLLNLLSGKLQPTSGTIKVGQTVKIGYFTQTSNDIDERLRAVEYIKEAAYYITLADGTRLSASQLMETFLFPSDLQWSPISKLSGGEKRRLFLLRILMDAPNVLLLDEPTNDLDLQTMAILEDFIDRFNGAIIFVSHDRFFVDRLAKKVFVYEEGGRLRQYPGGYSCYKAEQEREKEDHEATQIETQPPEKMLLQQQGKNMQEESQMQRRLTFKEQREYEEIELVIASVEGELKVVQQQMTECAGTDYSRLSELSQEELHLQSKLETLMERWEYLEETSELQK